ncbi:gephyrin-like molybdotransferase Glp [Paenibacillus oryzisoli]|uniref:molybdopterin molybdotransferase MoeA n=1 Tax=Paenibacillus oryzisoli TaxID=1850517 RepID=UPI003D2BAB60
MSGELKLKFGRKIVSVEDARLLLAKHAAPLGVERIGLAAAIGRRLAVDVYADHAVPHFRRSGVDGFAVRAADIAGATPEAPAQLRVVEHIPSGTMPQLTIQPGTCARIMTGAPVPDGADAVVMLEMTDGVEAEAATLVRVKKNVEAGSNITPVAGEVATGEQLLACGARIGPGEAAILATFGCAEVPVYRKPVVAIFSTGAELLGIDAALEPGKIRNSNSYMLAAQVEAAGGTAMVRPALSDDPAEVEAALKEILPAVDLVVTSGGVSVGDYDVLVSVFGRFDGELLFNKVAMRPGTPTSAALWNGKLLLALSGNPGASFVGFELFAKPVIDWMLGGCEPSAPSQTALLDVDYNKPSAYPRYVRGTRTVVDGVVRVQPAGIDKSSIMVSIKDADCLIYLPAGGQRFQRGELVTVYPTGDARR